MPLNPTIFILSLFQAIHIHPSQSFKIYVSQSISIYPSLYKFKSFYINLSIYLSVAVYISLRTVMANVRHHRKRVQIPVARLSLFSDK